MKPKPFYEAENVPSDIAAIQIDKDFSRRRTALCALMPPVIDKPLDEIRDVELQQLAVYAVVGEFTDPMLAHALVFQHLFSYHSPSVSMSDWMRHCLVSVPGEVRLAARGHLKKMHDGESENSLLWQRANHVVNEIVENGRDIFVLLHKVLDLDLRMCLWDDLVGIGLSPIASSLFMLTSRPCEHVVLSQAMIRWAVTIYQTWHSRKIKCLDAQPYLAPVNPKEYKEMESAVRSLQKQCFPGLSAVQAERLILESTNEHRENYNA